MTLDDQCPGRGPIADSEISHLIRAIAILGQRWGLCADQDELVGISILEMAHELGVSPAALARLVVEAEDHRI